MRCTLPQELAIGTPLARVQCTPSLADVHPKTQLNPVLAGNLDHEELECQRSARTALLYSVLGEDSEDLAVHHHLHDREQECQ